MGMAGFFPKAAYNIQVHAADSSRRRQFGGITDRRFACMQYRSRYRLLRDTYRPGVRAQACHKEFRYDSSRQIYLRHGFPQLDECPSLRNPCASSLLHLKSNAATAKPAIGR
jgi:hypothetical protein